MRPVGNVPGCLPSCGSPRLGTPWSCQGIPGSPLRAASVPGVQGAGCCQPPQRAEGQGTQVWGLSWCHRGIARWEGLTHRIHAELPLVLGLVGGGVQDAEVELGEEPHVLAGEDADVPHPPGPMAPRGDRARRGHVPEERRAGSCSTPCLLPRARLEERGPGARDLGVTSSFPVPPSTAGHHPHGTEGQPRSQSCCRVCSGCCVAPMGSPSSLLAAGSHQDGTESCGTPTLLLSVWARGRLGCVPTTSYLLYQ